MTDENKEITPEEVVASVPDNVPLVEEPIVDRRKEWRQIIITPESTLLPMIQQIIKQTNKDQSEVVITAINRIRTQKIKQEVKESYKIIFHWFDDDTCSFDLFKQMR
ncbi:MAG TPA: hypothetical protein DCS19_09380 [Flavobacterium sp.]|nr:hypothetical protein [Flavobacterium sp.]